MRMPGYLSIVAVVAALALVPLVTASNVTLNFLIIALLIALVGQGWNVARRLWRAIFVRMASRA